MEGLSQDAGTVIPAFFLMYVLLFLVMGIVYLEPVAVFLSWAYAALLIALIFKLHRPRLVHVRLLTPDDDGSQAHALPEGGSIRTPVRTRMSRYLVRDDSVLDLPQLVRCGFFSAWSFQSSSACSS